MNNYIIDVYDPNGVQKNTWTFTTILNDINDSLNTLRGQILNNPHLPYVVGANVVTTPLTAGYITVSVPIYGYDFELLSDSTATNQIFFQVQDEAIDVSLIGNMQPIAGHYVNGYSFVWSTTRDTLPVALPSILSFIPSGGNVMVNFSAPTTLYRRTVKPDRNRALWDGDWIVTVDTHCCHLTNKVFIREQEHRLQQYLLNTIQGSEKSA